VASIENGTHHHLASAAALSMLAVAISRCKILAAEHRQTRFAASLLNALPASAQHGGGINAYAAAMLAACTLAGDNKRHRLKRAGGAQTPAAATAGETHHNAYILSRK